MSLTALEWGLRAPITPRFGGNLEALPRPQDTEPKQQQKTDLKHKESDRPDLAEIWRYRDLLFLLVHRDFVSNYKQTVLGPLWFIIQPLLTTIVFTIIFGKVAKIPTDGMPPMLFYLAGLLGWNFFSRTLSSTSSTLTSNLGLFGKVYFPRLVVPLAAVVSSFIALAIQLVTLLAFWCYFKFFTSAGPSIQPGWDLLLFPLIVLQISALGLGVGLWLSALTAKYRDLAFLTGTLVQLWMYATPIIYPVSQIPEKWRWVSSLNPHGNAYHHHPADVSWTGGWGERRLYAIHPLHPRGSGHRRDSIQQSGKNFRRYCLALKRRIFGPNPRL
jgi:lipopolysaccharide transport system permease protein